MGILRGAVHNACGQLGNRWLFAFSYPKSRGFATPILVFTPIEVSIELTVIESSCTSN